MYTEYNPPYEWQMPQMPPQMPPQMHPAYTQQQPHHQQHQQPHYRPRVEMPEPDVMLSGEVRIARGFNSLVKCMLRKMTRSLAQSPVEMSVVPFAAFEAIATQPSSSRAREADREDAESALDIRGSAPSVLAFPVHVPTSIDDALTKQMEFVDWMITQSATNVHHSHHASFHAALLVVRGELRFTRLVHRHAAGASLYNGDKELQPVPDFDSALAGLDLPLTAAAPSADRHAPSHRPSSAAVSGPLTPPTKPKAGSPLTGESMFEPGGSKGTE